MSGQKRREEGLGAWGVSAAATRLCSCAPLQDDAGCNQFSGPGFSWPKAVAGDDDDDDGGLEGCCGQAERGQPQRLRDVIVSCLGESSGTEAKGDGSCKVRYGITGQDSGRATRRGEARALGCSARQAGAGERRQR